MEFQVNTNNVILSQIDQVESGEYNVTECNFTFSSEFDGLTKKAVFTGEDGTAYLQTIVDNKCSIPSEILATSQVVQIGVYAYAVENEELILRYSPEPTDFFIHEGSYKEAQNSTPPTPSEVEQLQAQITSNKNDIEEIQGDVVDINQDIVDIKAEQITQNENIQTNANNISIINEQISDINETITNLETNKANVTDLNDLTERVSTNERDIDTIDGHISDINQNIDDLEQDLTNYSLITETGSQINLNINSTNYQITAILKDKNGNVIYTSNAIDLPIESMIVNARYDNTTKEIVLTLQNGNTLRISVADLVSGLVSTDQLTQILSNYYNKNEVDALIPDLTDYVKNTDYATSTKGGVVKTNSYWGTAVNENGVLTGAERIYSTYQNAPNELLIAKGTLENVITGKELINQTQLEESQALQDTEIEALQNKVEELETDNENLRKALPQIKGEGTDITLENTSENKFVEFGLEGRTEQDGEPTPETPIPIKNVTGNANVKIQNKNLNQYGIKSGLYNASNGKWKDFANYVCMADILKIKSNSTITVSTKEGNAGNFYILEYDENKTYLNISNVQRNVTNATFTVGSTTEYIAIDFTYSGATVETVKDIQVEIGSTATSYVEHQEQNYPFTFAEGQRGMQGTELKDDGIHNTWKQVTITKIMLNPTIVTSYSELDYIRIGVPRGYIGGGRINVSLMSCANENKTWEFNDKKYIGTYTNRINYNYFYIGLPKGTSYDDIKNEIIGQVIEYKLADSELESNIIPYNETQQAQYNAIKNARSYDDITYITSESDELGFNMNVVAVADANKVIDNQNSEIDTIKSRLDLLEG